MMTQASAAPRFMSDKNDMNCKSIRNVKPIVVLRQTVGFASTLFCQAPTCGRSEGEAVAVRGRSFCCDPRPGDLAEIVAPPLLPACLLTPARWDATSWRGQSWQCDGSGVAVSGETGLKPWRNHQLSDIFVFSCWFQRFHAAASRDARVPVCVCTYAYTCEENAETLKPLVNIYLYQHFSGFRKVSKRFQPETVQMAGKRSSRMAGYWNILADGYSPICSMPSCDGSFGDLRWDWSAKVLAIAAGGGVQLGDGSVAWALWLSGCNWTLLHCSPTRDGMVATERLRQGADSAGFFVYLHLIINQMDAGPDLAGDAFGGVAWRRVPTLASPSPTVLSRAPWRSRFFGFGLSDGRNGARELFCAEQGPGVGSSRPLRLQPRVGVVVAVNRATRRKTRRVPGVQRGFGHVN